MVSPENNQNAQMPTKEGREDLLEKFTDHVLSGDFDSAVELKESCRLPSSIIENESVKDVWLQIMVSQLTKANKDDCENLCASAKKFLKAFDKMEESLPEIKEVFLKLVKGKRKTAIIMHREFEFSDEYIRSGEFREIVACACVEMITKLDGGLYAPPKPGSNWAEFETDPKRYKNVFNIPQDYYDSIIKRAYLINIEDSNIMCLSDMLKNYPVYEEITSQPEIIEKAKVCVLAGSRSHKYYKHQAVIIKNFKFNQEFVNEVVKSNIMSSFAQNIEPSLYFIEQNFKVDLKDDFFKTDDIKSGALTFINASVGDVRNYEMLLEIIDKLEIRNEDLFSEENKNLFARSIACSVLAKYHKGGYDSYAKLIKADFETAKKTFNMSDELMKVVTYHFLVQAYKVESEFCSQIKADYGIANRDVVDSLEPFDQEKINYFAENLNADIFESGDYFQKILLMSNESFVLLKENPFLMKALKHNFSMGFKLVFKYGSLDIPSHEAICEIFNIKERVLSANPNVLENSHEFRVLAQEELAGFKNNQQTIAEMKNVGIKTNSWLNYDDEEVFSLGGSEASFGEMVKAPSERIAVVLAAYKEGILKALDVHRQELVQASIDKDDIGELLLKVERQKQSIEIENGKEVIDQKKVAGIVRGLEILQRQIDNPEKINAWMKIMGDLDLLKKAFEKSLKINSEIVTLDEEIKNLLEKDPAENRRMIFIKKKMIGQKTIEFRNSLDVSAVRLDEILGSVFITVSKVLGIDKSDDLIHEISKDVLEHKEHFLSDKKSLELLLSEGDIDSAGSLIKIKIWDRNPDIDLYMGNYTDCCVRIDSEYHEAECPIADYITDPSIQVIAMYNEETGEPFAAAWCWPGKSVTSFATHEKYLVVDNIEAFGPNLKYKQQLEDRLRKYIMKYAKACGFDEVYQGEDNNDLVAIPNSKAGLKRLVRLTGITDIIWKLSIGLMKMMIKKEEKIRD